MLRRLLEGIFANFVAPFIPLIIIIVSLVGIVTIIYIITNYYLTVKEKIIRIMGLLIGMALVIVGLTCLMYVYSIIGFLALIIILAIIFSGI